MKNGKKEAGKMGRKERLKKGGDYGRSKVTMKEKNKGSKEA